jgi:hypothetical protein
MPRKSWLTIVATSSGAAVAKDGRRSLLEGASLRRDHLPDELVVRQVLAERLADPGVKVPDGLDPDPVRVGPEEVHPLVGPVVGVFGAKQEPVDESNALVGVALGEERSCLLGGRQPADRVERHAPEVGCVVDRNRRQDGQLLEPGPDEAVDEVAPGEPRVGFGRDLAGHRDRDVAGGELAVEPGGDSGLAGDRTGLDQSVGVHGRHCALARLEGGEVSDVDGRAVGVPGFHGDLLLFAAGHDPLGRLDANSLDPGGIRGRSRQAVGDPATEGLIERPPRLDPPSAAVRHLRGRLAKQEAVLGRRGEDPPPARLAGDRGVVEIRVETEQRKLEAVLSARLAVAGPGIAAGPRQDRNDIVLERHPGNRARTVRFDGRRRQRQARDRQDRGQHSSIAAPHVLLPRIHQHGRVVSLAPRS